MKTIKSLLAVPAVATGILLSFGTVTHARVYGSVDENHVLYGEPVKREQTETGFKDFHKITGYTVTVEYYKGKDGQLTCIGESFKDDTGAQIAGNELTVILALNGIPNRSFKWHPIELDGTVGWVLLDGESPYYGSNFANLSNDEKMKVLLDQKTAMVASPCVDLTDNSPYLSVSSILKFKMDIYKAAVKSATGE